MPVKYWEKPGAGGRTSYTNSWFLDITPCHRFLDHISRNGGLWEIDGSSDWVHPKADPDDRADPRYPPNSRFKISLLFARQSPGFAATHYTWWPSHDDKKRHKKTHVGKFECTPRGEAMWATGALKLRGPVTECPDTGRLRAVMTPFTTFANKDKIVFEVPTGDPESLRTRLTYYAYRRPKTADGRVGSVADISVIAPPPTPDDGWDTPCTQCISIEGGDVMPTDFIAPIETFDDTCMILRPVLDTKLSL